MLFFFPRDLLDEIWDLIGSVSEGFPTYSCIIPHGTVIEPRANPDVIKTFMLNSAEHEIFQAHKC